MILACSMLEDHLAAAQEKMGTSYEVVLLDRIYHREPKEMRDHVREALAAMPGSVDTVLVAMGFCGGSWDGVCWDRRLVLPQVDDCVSLVLHTDGAYHFDLKQMGHLYMMEKDPKDFDMADLFKRSMAGMPEGIPEEALEELYHCWFDAYDHLDVVELPGVTDCRSREYRAEAERNAVWLNAALDYVEGSNIILEKLVSGQWDEQFLVVEPGELIDLGRFCGL